MNGNYNLVHDKWKLNPVYFLHSWLVRICGFEWICPTNNFCIYTDSSSTYRKSSSVQLVRAWIVNFAKVIDNNCYCGDKESIALVVCKPNSELNQLHDPVASLFETIAGVDIRRCW